MNGIGIDTPLPPFESEVEAFKSGLDSAVKMPLTVYCPILEDKVLNNVKAASLVSPCELSGSEGSKQADSFNRMQSFTANKVRSAVLNNSYTGNCPVLSVCLSECLTVQSNSNLYSLSLSLRVQSKPRPKPSKPKSKWQWQWFVHIRRVMTNDAAM